VRRFRVLAVVASLTIGLLASIAAVSSAGTIPAGPDSGSFVSIAPERIIDTRDGTGAPAAPIAPGDTLTFDFGGADSGIAAVVMNVTVTQPTAAGYITVYPGGTTRPLASNLNFGPGQTVPNLVVAPIGADGTVAFYNGSAGTIHLVVDTSGYYLAGAPTQPGTLEPVPPTRLLDTRDGTGAPQGAVAPNGTVALQVAGRGGVPSSGVSAVILNVTVTAPQAPGYITVYGDGTPQPLASNLNFSPGQTVPNLVMAPVGPDGKVDLFNGSAGDVHLVADVSGYYLAGTATERGTFTSMTPTRILDTRIGLGGSGVVPAGGTVSLVVAGSAGIPTLGVAAVILNVTVTQPTSFGYITVSASGSPTPLASNLNFSPGQTVPNLVVSPVGPDGVVTLYNGSAGTVHLVADVTGYLLSRARDAWGSGRFFDRPSGGFQSISCPSSTFCVAVDRSGYATLFNGTSWTEPEPVGGLRAVSCVSDSYCVGIGDGAAYVFNGTAWSTAIPSPPTFGAELLAISCTSTTLCNVTGPADRSLTFSGMSWVSFVNLGSTAYLGKISCPTASFCMGAEQAYSAQTFVKGPSGWGSPIALPNTGILGDLSCASASFCVATDTNGNAFVFDGSSWSAPDQIDGDGSSVVLSAVSCPTVTFCLVVDSQGKSFTFDGVQWSTSSSIGIDEELAPQLSCPSAGTCFLADNSGRTFLYDHGTWSPPDWVDPVGGGAGISVSCPTSMFCGASDLAGNVLTYDGTTWTVPREVAPDAQLVAISCASSTFCLTVDRNGGAFVYNGTAWNATPDPSDPTGYFTTVSCVSETFCMAADNRANTAIFNGSTWSSLVATHAYQESNQSITSVSCASPTTCIAVDIGGEYLKYNGASWTYPVGFTAGQPAIAVSCPIMASCLAVDAIGNGYLYDGASWTIFPMLDNDIFQATAVSCGSGGRCIAVGTHAKAMTFDQSGWSDPHPLEPDGNLTSVSCSTERACIGVDDTGKYFKTSS